MNEGSVKEDFSAEKSLSVIMLTASFYPYIGGVETQVLELSRFLLNSNVKVKILTRKVSAAPRFEIINGISVNRLFAPGKGFINSIFFMFSTFFYLLYHKKEFEIIHVHLASSPAISACAAAFLTGRKVILTIAGGIGINEINLSEKTFMGRLKLKLISLFKPAILAVNKDIAQDIKKHGIKNTLVNVLGNGVDTEKFAPLSMHEKNELKKSSGFSDVPVFLFVGRFSPEKRISELIWLWTSIKKSISSFNAKLILVGEGPLEDEVREKAISCGIKNDITIIGKQENPVKYYQMADVFILPSVSEGFSCAMLEAMSCGLAILSSRVGGAKEVITKGKNGFLFDPFNPEEIKEYILKLAEDKKLLADFGKQSRKIAVENYSMSKISGDMVKIYKSLLVEK